MTEHPMPPPEGELITAALKRIRPKVSVREAARRAGISEGWWRQVVQGYQPLRGGQRAPMRGSAEVVAAMAQVVGATPQQLEEAGRADAAEELRSLPPPEEPERELTLAEIRAELARVGEEGERRHAENARRFEELRQEIRRLREEREATEEQQRKLGDAG